MSDQVLIVTPLRKASVALCGATSGEELFVETFMSLGAMSGNEDRQGRGFPLLDMCCKALLSFGLTVYWSVKYDDQSGLSTRMPRLIFQPANTLEDFDFDPLVGTDVIPYGCLTGAGVAHFKDRLVVDDPFGQARKETLFGVSVDSLLSSEVSVLWPEIDHCVMWVDQSRSFTVRYIGSTDAAAREFIERVRGNMMLVQQEEEILFQGN